MSINLQDLQELLTTIGQTNITDFELKTDEFEIKVSKGTPVAAVPMTVPIAAPVPSVAPSTIVATTPVAASLPEPVETPAAPSPLEQKWVAITSPMVGTFYRASAPGEDPFVSQGDRVSVGQTVCIIEAMKLMNEIEAEISGQVMEIAVADGEPIEYGQTLLWINPG